MSNGFSLVEEYIRDQDRLYIWRDINIIVGGPNEEVAGCLTLETTSCGLGRGIAEIAEQSATGPR